MSGKTGGYGPNMMRSYGFVVPGNPSDRVELPNQSQLPWLKTEGLLTATGFTLGALPRYWLGDHFDGRLKYSRASRLAADRDPEEGLTLARRRCVLLSIDKWGKLWGGPLERAKVYLAEERGRVRKVQAAFEQALASLPTRIEEDEQLLADLGGGEAAPGRPLTVAAVRARLEHKRLLREGVRMMQLYDTWLAERIGRRARGRSRVLGAS
ncbi:hypothetical protein HYH03_018345 [Edaphochlamys debaryana]|uniref:Uncharacterized protein n=1 Tax=Edaphochlamys debaryana TaxID=47281 RepID=A0A835XI53_9CHLO|nr:hypothetical protein HYH03_018345 [Edaphochlamys debaryana]|eukprot:KAG2482751.1 hypothetical protein HYH03_018345 [Edaphochlamys debaryana]